MRTSPILDVIFDPHVIEDYLKLGWELESDTGLKMQFPFASHEFAVLRWHLTFTSFVFAYKFLNDGHEQFLREFYTRLGQQEEMVEIGDYINARVELACIRTAIGMRGWLSPIRKQRVPLRMISGSVAGLKIETMLGIFSHVEQQAIMMTWSEHQAISEAFSLCILVSYWGREPNPYTEGHMLEGLADLIYENVSTIEESLQNCAESGPFD